MSPAGYALWRDVIRARLGEAYADSPRWKGTREGFVVLLGFKILVCEAD